MNQKETTKAKDNLESMRIEGVDHVKLLVRNINGEGVLFTESGRMIGHQIAHMGHYYYMGHGTARKKMYRATFMVDTMKSDIPKNGDK